MRARFTRNPVTVLREFGIDPAPYNLPAQLSDAQLDRFLADWCETPAHRGPFRPAPPGPAPVYGPPPGLFSRSSPPRAPALTQSP